MNKIAHFTSYFNPLAKNPCSDREALTEFQELDRKSQVKTVALTILAFIGTLFIAGLGAVAVFRLCTKKFSVVDTNQNTNPTITKTTKSFKEAINPSKAESPKTQTSSVQTTTQALTPTGFKNYHNNCWVNAGMQVLLASKWFEEIVNQPLKLDVSETSEDLQKRENVRKALVDFIKIREGRDPVQIENAMKELHTKMIESDANNFYKMKEIGSWGESRDFIENALNILRDGNGRLIHWAGGWTEYIFELLSGKPSNSQRIFELYFNGVYPRPAKQKKYEQIPDLIVLLGGFTRSCNVNTTIDLSKYFKDAKYRAVGIVKILPNHSISYVRKQDQWYKCNDSVVQKVSLTEMNLSDSEVLVLERI